MGVQRLSALRSPLRFETAGLNTEPVIPRHGYGSARLPYTAVAIDGSRRPQAEVQRRGGWGARSAETGSEANGSNPH